MRNIRDVQIVTGKRRLTVEEAVHILENRMREEVRILRSLTVYTSLADRILSEYQGELGIERELDLRFSREKK